MSSQAKAEEGLCLVIPLGRTYWKVVEKRQKRMPRTPRARWTWTSGEYAASLSVSILLLSGKADHFSFSAQTFLLNCNAEKWAEAAPRLCSALHSEREKRRCDGAEARAIRCRRRPSTDLFSSLDWTR